MTRTTGAFALLCLIFGTTFAAIAIGLQDGWPPLLSAGLRFATAGLVVLAFARLTGGPIARPSRRDVGVVVFVGMTVTAATFGTLYTAETALPSGLAALVSASSPLFAFALAVAMRARRIDAAAVGGIAIGTLGVALIVGVDAARIGPAAMLGALAIVVSEFAFAAGLTATKRSTLPILILAGAQQVFGGAILLALSLVFEHRGPTHVDARGLLALGYLTLIGSAFAHTVSIWLASATSATFASSWTYVAPFVALLVGALLLHEPIGGAAWFGGVLVVIGALALNREQLFPKRVQRRDAA